MNSLKLHIVVTYMPHCNTLIHILYIVGTHKTGIGTQLEKNLDSAQKYRFTLNPEYIYTVFEIKV